MNEQRRQRVNRISQMDRKSLHLWPDQVDQLDAAVTEMRRQHRGRGNDTITRDSLIRTAVDVFVRDWPAISGADENDLRTQVGLPGRGPDGRILPPVVAAPSSAPSSPPISRTPSAPLPDRKHGPQRVAGHRRRPRPQP